MGSEWSSNPRPAARRLRACPGFVGGVVASCGVTAAHPFDVEAFLARPLVAGVAAAGPSIRSVWFLWEDGAFWWITGAYGRLLPSPDEVAWGTRFSDPPRPPG